MTTSSASDTSRKAPAKAALVTGGAVRLGKAITLRLARAGYDIALHYHSSSAEAAATQAEIEALGVRCAAYAHDLADAEGIDGLLDRVFAALPHTSVLVNCASGYEDATIAETSVALFDRLFSVNLRAPFFLTRAFLRHCRSGSIVNVLDNKIGFNQNTYAAYVLSKKALAELTRLSAIEGAPDVRVNAVAPGVVLPAATRSDEYIRWRLEAIPLGVQGTVANVTDAVLHLIDNDFVTGQTLVVDGGESLANTGRDAARYDPEKV